MPEATSSGEPDAGNLHVRFVEGRGTSVPSYSTRSVSISSPIHECPNSRRHLKGGGSPEGLAPQIADLLKLKWITLTAKLKSLKEGFLDLVRSSDKME